ncbi:hypothetical protein [Parasphingorhabdus sp.]|uniref:hypothetical protein n=1 Tax=Parasphingorhabdus sp. TaxID=2709688 RepID=UPI0032985C09
MRAVVEGNYKAPELLNGEIAEHLRGTLQLGEIHWRMAMSILKARNLGDTKY